MLAATRELITRWAEGLGGFFGLFAIWGAVRARFVRTLIAGEPGTPAGEDENDLPPRLRMLLTIYLVLYALVLVRHQVVLGYLSDRHLLPLVAVSMPWAAAGTFVCARRAATAAGLAGAAGAAAGGVLVVLAVVAAIVLPQSKPGHPSRWGHWAAGRWLQAHARTRRRGARHPGLGVVRLGPAELRLLARPPGAHRPAAWPTSSSAPTS